MSQVAARFIQLHIVRRTASSIEYLVLHRSSDEPVFPNLWQVVTGGIDQGETAIEAAIREMREETSLEPITMWAVPFVASFYSIKRDEIQSVPVFAALVAEGDSVILSHEHQAFEWLPYEAALERLIFPSHKEGMEYVSTYIIHASGEIPFAIVAKK
ncbi:MAG TPA: NUDIX pyrophosphatase [Candidatus Kapabacteria bacterium]|nr:NUDIX pyrophosphatase [Candidatus Kapabacteria bacterium]